ncbi:MAG: Gamma-glutamyl phosphate reductase [Verrucomicrobia subdivision 3 bacterium]|nr:Gamma-glutamyl phosphate reductase [Limisphaerales bacterium]MCS1415266.1 Gamma-glutamyl phosphate reductase [Limisphaerales bacterium]
MLLQEQMTEIARRAKIASRGLLRLSADQRNACLNSMADAIDTQSGAIQTENQKDLEFGREWNLSSALLDRLKLTDKRIAGMSQGLREVADLPDPVGRVLNERIRPNGLKLQKVSTPIGVVVIIYESRPNVTADAAGLCLKSGNATILRGGKEAVHSNQIIAKTMVEAAHQQCSEFPLDVIQVIPTTDRQAIPVLLSLTEYIDLCLPRGGEGLIRVVAECSRVPVIKHYKGICHVYVDRDADLNQAAAIAVNAKTQRAGVCNAIETLLIDDSIKETFAPRVVQNLWEQGVEIRGDESLHQVINSQPRPEGAKFEMASEDDWKSEYLDLILSVRIVEDVNAAIEHINTYGSGHSDAIVTKNEETAKLFMSEVDASAVYWNASTRFTDGAEFGMGAEIGISTDKIGARGPMGLEELTSYKWLGYGEGQIRN